MYSRDVAGRTLTFGVSRKLWKNAQVLYDRETNSLWSHLSGEAIRGPLKGSHLTRLAGSTPRVTWSAWRKLHPTTLVLSVNGREDIGSDIYKDYHTSSDWVGYFPVPQLDRRVPPKDMVLGIVIGQASTAYPHTFLRKRRLVSDTVGGRPVLAWFDPASGATAVYERPAAENGFRLRGGTIVGADGGRWQAATGRALGPGPNLEPLPHTNAYWFGWSAFYPRTVLKAE